MRRNMTDIVFQVLPQTVLGLLACLFILGASFGSIPRGSWNSWALAGLVAAGCALHFTADAVPLAGTTAVAVDSLSRGFQWGCLIIGGLFVLMARESQAKSETAAEFHALVLLVICGMMLVSAANELILLFLGLELVSIPTYVLLYLDRRDYAAQEATTKYFLLSILSAALLLYGFAFVYGLTGTTHLSVARGILTDAYAVAPGLPPTGGSVLGVVALVLIFAGLGFKVAAVPFHFYAPDVYQGTTPFNAGLLAVAPKAAGFVAMIRVLSETMVGFEVPAERVAIILAMITMTGGNVLALLQTNVRRLLAYSSIAHAGYMLIGIAVGFWEAWNPQRSLGGETGLPGGISATLFYLFVYSLASVGLFAVLIYLPRPGRQVEHIDDLTGLGRTQPLLAIAAALFLFSMAGIPPLPGFWGKLSLFMGALNVRSAPDTLHYGFLALAIVGAINAAIGAAYYLRLVAIMFLQDPISVPQPSGGKPAFAAVLLAAALSLALSWPKPLLSYVNQFGLQREISSATIIASPKSLTQTGAPRQSRETW
jgi:NADH-quinone oxidoreductase subunit N